MSTEPPRAEPRVSPHAASMLALLSPLLCGVAWGVVALFSWLSAMDAPDASLNTLVAFWGVLFYGFIGLALLAIPLTVGLVARTLVTRMAAAWVEAGMCGLAALVLLINSVPHGYYRGSGPLGYAAIVALLVPTAATALATRVVGLRDA